MSKNKLMVNSLRNPSPNHVPRIIKSKSKRLLVLLVVRLISQHEHTVAEIMKIAAVCRQTVFTYRDKVLTEGVKGLLKRDWNGARKPAVRGAVAEEFLESLGEGKFRQARDAQTWIKKRTKNTASPKKAAPYLKLSIRPRENILIPPTCTPDVNEMHFA